MAGITTLPNQMADSIKLLEAYIEGWHKKLNSFETNQAIYVKN